MALDANGFRKVMGLRAAGVTVVTTRDRHGEPRGFTATAVCSVSLAPPLILVCIDRTAECYEAFQEAEAFAVNLLREDQEPLSRRFAQKTARKFAGIPASSGHHRIAHPGRRAGPCGMPGPGAIPRRGSHHLSGRGRRLRRDAAG